MFLDCPSQEGLSSSFIGVYSHFPYADVTILVDNKSIALLEKEAKEAERLARETRLRADELREKLQLAKQKAFQK